MIIQRFLTALLLPLLLACLPFAGLKASSESYMQSITGHLKKGDSLTVIDDKFLNLPLAEWNRLKHLSIEDVVSFELRQDTALNYYTKSFSCTLNVTIKYYTSRDQQTPKEIDNVDLVVRYDTTRGRSFPVISRYRFKDAFKVTVVVNSISSPEWKDKLPDVFRLKAQILVDRKYPFDRGKNGTLHLGAYQPPSPAAQPGFPMEGLVAAGPLVSGPVPSGPAVSPTDPIIGLQVADGSLSISWGTGAFSGEEDYDVEWTYIDAQSGHGQYIKSHLTAGGSILIPDDTEDSWMDHDATRATVTSSPYKISLPYGEGYLLVRVRKGSYPEGMNMRQVDTWIRLDDNGNTAMVATTPFNEQLNWQYTGSFAGDGKKKEVVTWFDGSAKNRQMVTLSNADHYTDADHNTQPVAIVQETIYDAMGRTAVNMLPAPTRNNLLTYYPGFNVNNVNAPYSFTDITTPSGSCGIAATSAGTSSGASQYYSPNNSFLNQPQPSSQPDYLYTRYVPDAVQHPFSVTQYTADNTGRIRRQGGVGPDLQVGTAHDTKYFYSKPTPRELERLFGMEVGNSSHYIKNMVVDPNGQASVTYIDANGKTIATALAGATPNSVDALTTQTAKTLFDETLIKPADFSTNSGGLNMTSSSTFVVEVSGDFAINYTVNPLALVTTYGGNNQLCNNCYYTVSVKVTDECGSLVPNGQATTTPFQLNDFTCQVNPQPITQQLLLAGLAIGEYTVTYTLQLSNDAINAQTDYYIQHNTDLQKLDDFFRAELTTLDLGACYNTCDACKTLTSVGEFSDRVKGLLTSETFSGVDLTDQNFANFLDGWISSTYTTLKNRCNTLSCVSSPCEEKLTRLKLDVQPGGQYALYDASALAAGATTGLFLDLPTNVLPYYTTDNTISSLTFTADDGTMQTVGSLNQADFIRAYLNHPEWADQFVLHHIEYCSYLWCKDGSNPTPAVNNEVSYTFDAALQQSYPSGSDAATAGYYNHADVLALLKKDPWFNGGRGGAYYSKMQTDLQGASDVLSITPKDGGTSLGVKNLVQLVDWILYCKPTDPNVTAAQADASWQSCTVNDNCRSATMEWTLYRNYYLQLKSKYYRIAKLATPGFQNCLDCFIGMDPLATAGCVVSGQLSDYTVVKQVFGSTTTFNLIYKNGTAPFAGDYTFSYDIENSIDGSTSGAGQVSAHIGDMSAVVFSITLPPGQQYGMVGQYVVTNAQCTPSAVASCAAIASNPPPCPVGSEFTPYYQDLQETTDEFGNQKVTQEIGLGHNGVPMSRDVIIHYTLNMQSCMNCQAQYIPQQKTFPAGALSMVMGKNVTFYNSDGTYSSSWFTINLNDPAAIECPVQSPPSTCTSNPNYASYKNKMRVFNDYTDIQDYNACNASSLALTTLQQSQAQAMTVNLAAAMDNLSTMQASWLRLLQSVRDEEFAGDPDATAALNNTVLQDLTAKMQQLSATYLQIASAQGKPLVISSTLPSPLPAGYSAPNGYMSYGEIFNAVVGSSLVQRGFSPDLIDGAYAYDQQPAPADANVIQLSPDIYDNVVANLAAFQSRWQTAGSPGTFGTWLKQQLGDDYLLSDTELADLQTRLTSGCPYPYLANPVFLPVAFTVASARSSIGCSRITDLKAQFASTYPGVTVDSKLYQILITNFLNHSTGYPLSYSEYSPLLQGACTAGQLVYDKPQSITILNDYFDCSANLLKQTYTRAGEEYDIYITQKRIEFRNAYIAKCLSNQASARLRGYRQEYHYTLYYYDQSGLLVKTIPPEGVRLLTEEEIDEVEALPAQDPSSCALPPSFVVTDPTTILNGVSSGLQGSARSMELWLYNNDGTSTRQLRMITPDNKYMYQAAIYGGKVWAELYTLLPDGNGGISITLTNQAVGLLPGQLPLLSWTHVVIQSTGGLSAGTIQLYVDGNKLTMLSDADITGYPFPWSIAAGFTLPAIDLTAIKHLRLYNQTLSDADIVSDFKNSCLAPADDLMGSASPLMTWGRLDAPGFCNNNTGRETPIQVPNKGSLQITTNPDPTGNINLNGFRDVQNDFTVEFWANPALGVLDAVTPGYLYSGVYEHPPYAIAPTHGGITTRAGMGVSVGRNGITVFEHTDNYLPAVLDLRITITDWTHVAVVYSEGIPNIFVNGIQKTFNTTQSPKNVFPSYNFGGGVYGFMPGGLDEVRIWNYARSADQISKAYSRVLSPGESQGLLGYWPMDNTSGAVFHDISCSNINTPFSPMAESWLTTGAPLTETNLVEFASRFIVPNHGLPTNYAYNSLNLPIKQSSPDGGISNLLYDRLGRHIVSQNSEQLQPAATGPQNPAGRYSYTRYDILGRVTEVGEKLGGSVVSASMARDDDAMTAWYNSGNNRQVTVTTYDNAPSWVPSGIDQGNLRKRVTAVAVLSQGSDPTQNRQAATYYTYDVNGNISGLVQENAALVANETQRVTGSNGLKHIQYEYDLVTGKVNKILYQPGKWDQFYYQYKYDDNNRIIDAYTSRVNDIALNMWKRDAHYTYYHHGPLARVELGDPMVQQVQGVDYAYTLQGWLKGVNGQQLSANASTDMGADGAAGSPNSTVARDVMAYSLGYHQGDYLPIGGSDASAFGKRFDPSGSNTASGADLYNGNISSASYALDAFEGMTGGVTGFTGYSYRYDQLNRLTGMDYHKIDPYTGAGVWDGNSAGQDYRERVSYDGNGNILQYNRNGRTVAGRGNSMDQLTYNYNRDANGNLVNNRLRHVIDGILQAAPAGDPQDVTSQSVDNYSYDAIGDIIGNQKENLTAINWTVYGKVAGIVKADGSTLDYGYDPTGKRINKTYKTGTGAAATSTTTHYVRDAKGNVLAVYQYKADGTGALTEGDWLEQHLYGNSRLGILQPHKAITNGTGDAYSEGDEIADQAGNRLYELTNHLGNVLATINDVPDPAGMTPNPNVMSAQDYYPFGMPMPGRSYIAGGSLNYRFGFNGKENDNEVSGTGGVQDYGMRIYDPRLGKFLSVDPIADKYPELTPYQFASNRPIDGVDQDGKEWYYYNSLFNRWALSEGGGPTVIYSEQFMNRLGYFSLPQVREFQRLDDVRADDKRYEEGIRAWNEGVLAWNRMHNLFWQAYMVSGFSAIHDAIDLAEDGHYGLAAVVGISGAVDLSPLWSTFGKGYAKVATEIAGQFTASGAWKLGNFARGAILEAKAAMTIFKDGYEWLANISPFFRTIDFYEKIKLIGVSYKTVNALAQDTKFANLYENVARLKEMLSYGKTAQFGEERIINGVQLYLQTPAGYKNEAFDAFLKWAKDELGESNVILNSKLPE
jgi:RHS repeat-associated protein